MILYHWLFRRVQAPELELFDTRKLALDRMVLESGCTSIAYLDGPWTKCDELIQNCLCVYIRSVPLLFFTAFQGWWNFITPILLSKETLVDCLWTMQPYESWVPWVTYLALQSRGKKPMGSRHARLGGEFFGEPPGWYLDFCRFLNGILISLISFFDHFLQSI